MENKYDFHEDLKDIKKVNFKDMKLTPFKLKLINLVGKATCTVVKIDPRLKVTKIIVPGYKKTNLKVSVYEPINIDKNAPCIIYYHGGAFMAEGYSYMHKIASYYSLYAKCKLFFINYRLAPKYPFPIGVEDCYSSLTWIYDNADKLEINKDKIAVCGDSAGGTLAAAITHMSRDRNGPKICFQMLVYPATDISQNTQSIRDFTDSPGWNSNLNKQMWEKYLKDGDKGMLGYASPMNMENFKNLPDAYIEVEEFDCLRDEGIEYGEKLKKYGNKVELNYVKGTFHGFDGMAVNRNIVKETIKKRIDALKRAFYGKD